MKWALQKVPLRGLQGGKYASLEASSNPTILETKEVRHAKFLALAHLHRRSQSPRQARWSKRRDAIAAMYEKMDGNWRCFATPSENTMWSLSVRCRTRNRAP